MRVVCINSGSTKNLTEGNSYDVVRSTEDHYHIVNDRGITARYSSKLFKQEEVAIPAPPPPPPAPVVVDVVLDVRDVIIDWSTQPDSQDFDIDGDNDYDININVTNPHTNAVKHVFYRGSLTSLETPLSCGIMDISGFNSLIANVRNKLTVIKEELSREHVNLIITPEVCRTILANGLRTLADAIFESDVPKGIINFSSNITSNDTLTQFFGVNVENISDLFDHCFTTHNPNSGNMIFFGSFTN
jgi:hypothetical protein